MIKYVLGEDINNLNKKIEPILENQIDSFSMHKTYNLLEQAKFINDINEILSMLLYFECEVPEILNTTKLKMQTVLAQYFHKDGTVALFNGTNNYNLDKIKLAFRENENLRKIGFLIILMEYFILKTKTKKFLLMQYNQLDLDNQKD